MLSARALTWTRALAATVSVAVATMLGTLSRSVDEMARNGADDRAADTASGTNSQLCLGLRPKTLLPSDTLASGQPP